MSCFESWEWYTCPYLGQLVVLVFLSSVLNILPFSFCGKNFMVYKTKITVYICLSGFPMFSFLSPMESFLVLSVSEIFLSIFLPYFLTVKSTWNGVFGELGAWFVEFSGLQQVTTNFFFPPLWLFTLSTKCTCSHFYLRKQNVATKMESLWPFPVFHDIPLVV